MERRTFLGSSLLAYWPANKVRLGVIGSGSRGTFVMGVFQKDAALEVGAISDVYEPNLERALSLAKGAKAYRDYRDLLADKSIDAVLIATPEHWHHRMILDALAAGKDVYVEKPLCRTPEEGRELIEAEKKSKQVIQVGMQRRSYDLYQEARGVVAAGTLGKVRMVRSWWLNNHLNAVPPAKLDGKLDWEAWQGPAERRPFEANRFRAWRFYQDYGGGIVADQGAHVFDGIQMIMGAGFVKAVTASALPPLRAGVDQPDCVVVSAEYPEGFLGIFTVNYAAMKYQSRNDQLNQADGDKARLDIGRETFRVLPAGDEEKPILERKSARGFGWATDLHVQNFLECVRTRQRPTAPIALGAQAALVVQLANRSLREGRRIENTTF